jgi:tetratricopeptide (TPR) repeat protein
MKRAVFVLIIFAFILTNYGEAEPALKVVVTGEVIKIKEHSRFPTFTGKTGPAFFASVTITLGTEKGDITLPVWEGAWWHLRGDIKIGDIVSVVYTEPSDDWEKSLFQTVIVSIERTSAEEKARIIASKKVEQAKAQLPEAITLAKLGQIKEAIDIYLSIPEEVLTPDNIPLWNDRNDLLQALKPYVQQHKDSAKSLEAKGQYKEALNECAEKVY